MLHFKIEAFKMLHFKTREAASCFCKSCIVKKGKKNFVKINQLRTLWERNDLTNSILNL